MPLYPTFSVIGTTGIQGRTGLSGPAGAQGATGVGTGGSGDGATGIQGVTGIQGITGLSLQGSTGVQGVTGFQGATGLSGDAAVGARIRKTTTQSISSSTNSYATFDTEDDDSGGLANLGTNNDRLTFPTTGRYVITANTAWESNTTGMRTVGIEVYNASNVLKWASYDQRPAVNGAATYCSIADSVLVNATDYVKAYAWQTSDGALNLIASTNLTARLVTGVQGGTGIQGATGIGSGSGGTFTEQITWDSGLGAITHILGPTDQNLTISGNTSRALSLLAGNNGGGTGGAITLTSGSGGGNAAGGAVSITTGNGGNGGASGLGGAITIQSGDSGSGGGNGGTITIQVGAALTSNYFGASLYLAAGRGGPTGGGGGTAYLVGGAGGSSSGTAGEARVSGGAASAGNSTGGLASLRGGAPTGTGTGGAVLIRGADSVGANGSGGAITITAGSAVSSGGSAGAITITAGANAGGVGAAISITAGSGLTTGGALTLAGGAATSGNNVGGALSAAGGSGFGNLAGGAVTITGGTGGTTNGTGGVLSLRGGLSGAAAGTGGAIQFYTAAAGTGTTHTERMRINSDGVVLVGDPSITPQAITDIQISRDTYAVVRLRTANNSNVFPIVSSLRSRGTLASPSAVALDDTALVVAGGAYIGSTSTFRTTSQILFAVDGTPTDGSSLPGRLSFFTTPSGSLTTTERMRINNAGLISAGTAASTDTTSAQSGEILRLTSSSGTARLAIRSEITGAPVISFLNRRGSFGAETPIQSGDSIGSIGGWGSVSAGNYQAGASIDMSADDNWVAGSSYPSRIAFYTAPSGSTTIVERIRLGNDGTLRIGSAMLSASYTGDTRTQLILGNDGATSFAVHRVGTSSDAGDGPTYSFNRSRNTTASPQVVNSGDLLGRFLGQGYGGATIGYGSGGQISFTAEGTFTNTSCPGRIEFMTTPTSAVSPVHRMRIGSDGLVYIGSGISTTPIVFGGANGEWLHIAGSSANCRVTFRASGIGSEFAVLQLQRARGSLGAETAVTSGDALGQINFWGSIAAGSYAPGAFITGAAEDNWTNGVSYPARLSFATVPSGSTSASERWRITASGALTGYSAGSQLTWTTGLGAITHILGPADQSLSLIGGTNASGAGNHVEIRGGLPTDGVGGTVYLYGRNGVGTDRGGGSVTINAGNSSTGNANGGGVSLSGGTSGTTGGVGGGIVITAGASGGSSSLAGSVTINGGLGNGTSGGGSITITGGSGGATNATGGSLLLRGGLSGAAAGTGGIIRFYTAASGTGTTHTERWQITAAGALTGYSAGSQLTWTTGLGAISHILGPTDQNLNIAAGASNRSVTVNGNPLPQVISVTSVDLTTVAATNLYTVPTGKTLIVTGAIVKATTATSANGDAVAGIGVAAGEDDILSSQTLTGLNATTEYYQFPPGGTSYAAQAADVVKFGVDTGDTGTALVADVYLLGYLI